MGEELDLDSGGHESQGARLIHDSDKTKVAHHSFHVFFSRASFLGL